MNFLRIIDYGMDMENKIFGMDLNCVILCNEENKPSWCFSFFKNISKLETKFRVDQLRPIVREL